MDIALPQVQTNVATFNSLPRPQSGALSRLLDQSGVIPSIHSPTQLVPDRLCLALRRLRVLEQVTHGTG